jgi:hypothetical protein
MTDVVSSMKDFSEKLGDRLISEHTTLLAEITAFIDP